MLRDSAVFVSKSSETINADFSRSMKTVTSRLFILIT